MDVTIKHASSPLLGCVRVPSDKSISHRAVLFAAMADGVSRPTAVLDSADVRSTIDAVRALGARVRVVREATEGLDLEIEGWGAGGPRQPEGPVDCGNSGTTVRLLLGILAGWPIEVTLTGDDSLSRRPMNRVIEPLTAMGAKFEAAPGGVLPVTVRGGHLQGINYASPVASAQVKSAVLLAGLRAHGLTSVTEPALSRDHTERMLPAFGVPVSTGLGPVRSAVSGPLTVRPHDTPVPSDPSSAAFLAAAALLVPGSEVTLPGVGMNPTRSGFAAMVRGMGAVVESETDVTSGLEPVETLTVRHTPSLSAVDVSPGQVPAMIDEVPILALLATQAIGVTRFNGVGELRVKESDRLSAIQCGLEALGADVRAGDGWLEVSGPTPLRGATLSTLGDHRLAMTWAVAALIATGETAIEEFEAVGVSYPAFLRDLETLAEGGLPR